MLYSILSLAETTGGGGAMDSLIASMTTGFTTMTENALSAIGSIMPVALPVMGGMVLIRLGVRLFKQLTKG